jgi:hypothetical protein
MSWFVCLDRLPPQRRRCPMSAPELLEKVRAHWPDLRFTMSQSGCAIGEFVPAVGRFVPVYMLLLSGQWVATGGVGVCVNGQPLYKPEDWQE